MLKSVLIVCFILSTGGCLNPAIDHLKEEAPKIAKETISGSIDTLKEKLAPDPVTGQDPLIPILQGLLSLGLAYAIPKIRDKIKEKNGQHRWAEEEIKDMVKKEIEGPKGDV